MCILKYNIFLILKIYEKKRLINILDLLYLYLILFDYINMNYACIGNQIYFLL